MNQVEKDISEVLQRSELTDVDVREAVRQAEMIINAPSRETVSQTPYPRVVDKIREYRGLIMGTLGVIGGIGGAALAIVLFPDQHVALYSIIISPQQGMSAAGVAAGTSLGEFLTRS